MQKSTVASNRLVIDKINKQQGVRGAEYVPARYLEENKAELYKDWSLNHARQLVFKVPSKRTFYNYVKKMSIFKNPHRLTDLCEYCEEINKFKKTLPHNLSQLGYHQEIDDAIDLKKANTFMKDKQIEIIQQHGDLTEVLKLFL